MKDIVELVGPHPTIGGTVCRATTDKGNKIKVWTASSNLQATPFEVVHAPRTQAAHKLLLDIKMGRGELFCHGHSTGSFKRFGYSILGGSSMETLLRDEYRLVCRGPKSIKDARAGDVIVWRRKEGKKEIVHSAKLELVPSVPPFMVERIKISSKDTFGGFSHEWMPHYLREWHRHSWEIYRRMVDWG